MAEKKEKVSAYEKIQSQRKALVDKVIANMEKGYIWDNGWDINALRSQNPVSGAKYTGINRLHLGYVVAQKNYQDPRFITFKQAQDNNWRVKQGEHGYPCEYWIWTKKEEIENEKGEKEKVDVKLEKPMIRYFTVFNMEQIKGDYPKFELPKLSHDKILDVANDFIASSRCPIQEAAQDRAYYTPSSDRIILPLRDSFKTTEDYLATLLHEMAHSTGKELGREMGTNKMSTEYAKEELVAELSSLFLKAELGISSEGKHLENHSAYLNSWNSMLRSDPNELYRAAKEADKACAYIMDRYRDYIKTKDLIQENTASKEEEKINDPMEKLTVIHHWSEKDEDFSLGVPDETKLTGIEAYKFLEKIMELDDENNFKEETYKSEISLIYDDKINITNRMTGIGDDEFGGYTKVSEGLEHLLNIEPLDMIKNTEYYYEKSESLFGEQKSEAEIIEYANKELDNNAAIIADFKEKEDLIQMKEGSKEIESIDKFSITLNFSEYDFNIPDGTTLHGEEAYKLFKEIMEYDKQFNMERKADYYDKTYISMSYDNNEIFNNIRLDLGDRIFNGTDKASEAIKTFLPRYISMMKYPKEYEHLNKSKEEIVQEGTKVVNGIRMLNKAFLNEETKEKNMLKAFKKMVTNNMKKSKIKEEPKKTRVRSRVRTKKGMEI